MVIMDFLEVKVDHQQDMEGILLDHLEKTDHKEKIVDHLEKRVNDDIVSINHLVDIDTNLHEDDSISEVDHLVHLDQDKKNYIYLKRGIMSSFLTYKKTFKIDKIMILNKIVVGFYIDVFYI